jgi:hemerythrin-like domain-containing protein
MNLPDPQHYQDGILFFHDTHKIILHECGELEELLADAQTRGVFQSFAARPEWNDVFDFFQKSAPRHERDEDDFLFPAVAARVPRMGFQQPDSTIRFLTEGHEMLLRRMAPLLKDWEAFRSVPRDVTALEAAHDMHEQEDARFIANCRELVRLYREHIALEETRVYSVADKVLSGEEKLELIDRIREAYGNEAVTGIFNFDEPRFSNPAYNVIYDPTEVIAEETLEPDEEEDDEEDMI